MEQRCPACWRCGKPGPMFIWLLVLGGLFLSGHAVIADEKQQAAIQATMDDIFAALVRVFPLSLDEQQFQDPAQRQVVLGALRTLADNASKLADHSQDMSQTFHFLRRALLNNAQNAVQRYEQHDFQGAQFTLHRLTENCFACHTRLPAQQLSLGKRFLAEAQLDTLSLQERARLAVATRQFDEALTTYEALMRSVDMPAAEIDRLGTFEDYLKIALRVEGDFRRVRTTLETFQRRPDVPEELANLLVSWVEALKALQDSAVQDNPLAQAQRLIQEAQQRNRFPADRRGLVHLVVASSLLHRYVDADKVDRSRLAEAYYLLGVAESAISHSLWIPQTEFFLETAIRLNPGTPQAQKAYAFLEEHVVAGYTGSGGTHLPTDVAAQLAELRHLSSTPAQEEPKQ